MIGHGGIARSKRSTTWRAMAVSLVLGALVAGCGDDDSPASTQAERAPLFVVFDWEGRLLLVDSSDGTTEEIDLDLDLIPGGLGVTPDGQSLVLLDATTTDAHLVDLGEPSSRRPLDDPLLALRAVGAVSPDGEWVAFVDEASDLVVANLTTGERRVILNVADVPPEPYFACTTTATSGRVRAWPGPIELAVATPCEEVLFEGVVLVDPDADDPVLEEHQGDLAVSPAGDRFLAFVDWTAHLEWADGTSAELRSGFSPRWSSTGVLAFSQLRPGVGESIQALLVMDQQMSEPLEIARGYVGPLSWSPDGEVLLYYHTDGQTITLWSWHQADGARELVSLDAWPAHTAWVTRQTARQ